MALVQEIFSRQYKRMENELKDVNVPPAVITILSKYWSYCEKDIINKTQGDRNGFNREINGNR